MLNPYIQSPCIKHFHTLTGVAYIYDGNFSKHLSLLALISLILICYNIVPFDVVENNISVTKLPIPIRWWFLVGLAYIVISVTVILMKKRSNRKGYNIKVKLRLIKSVLEGKIFCTTLLYPLVIYVMVFCGRWSLKTNQYVQYDIPSHIYNSLNIRYICSYSCWGVKIWLM